MGVGDDDTSENNRDDITFVVVVSSIPGDQPLCNHKDNIVHHCSVCGTRHETKLVIIVFINGGVAIINGVVVDDGVDRIVLFALVMQV